jgi:hypothetical protein
MPGLWYCDVNARRSTHPRSDVVKLHLLDSHTKTDGAVWILNMLGVQSGVGISLLKECCNPLTKNIPNRWPQKQRVKVTF